MLQILKLRTVTAKTTNLMKLSAGVPILEGLSKLRVFYACLFVNMVGVNLTNPIIPSLIQQLGGDALDLSIITSLIGVSGIVGAWILGKIADIPGFGRRLSITIQYFGTSVAYWIMSISNSVGGIMIGAIFGAAANHASAPVLAYIADMTHPDDTPSYISLSGGISGIAIILGSMISTALLAVGVGFFDIFCMAIILCSTSTVCTFFLLQEPEASLQRRLEGSSTSLDQNDLKLRDLTWHQWALFIAMFTSYYGYVGPFSVYAVLIYELFGWQAPQLAGLITASGACFALAQISVKYLANLLGSLQLLSSISMVILSSTVLFLPLLTVPVFHVAAFLIMISSISILITSIPAQLAQETEGSKQGQIQGFGQAFQTTAGVISPLITGALFNSSHDTGKISFAQCAAFSLIGTALIFADWFVNLDTDIPFIRARVEAKLNTPQKSAHEPEHEHLVSNPDQTIEEDSSRTPETL
jgi:predicted MFS family arabinose efflux permease